MPGFNIPYTSCPPGADATSTIIASGYNGQSNTVETARSYRYLLDVLTPLSEQGSGGLLLFLKSASRPEPEIDEITIHNGQDEIYRPGKNRWSPVELTF